MKKYVNFKSALVTKLSEALTTLKDKLQLVSVELDSNQRLANSFKQIDNVMLGMPFRLFNDDAAVNPSYSILAKIPFIESIRGRMGKVFLLPTKTLIEELFISK